LWPSPILTLWQFVPRLSEPWALLVFRPPEYVSLKI
jgi:hypothetical protein